jgi:hypothetical protein
MMKVECPLFLPILTEAGIDLDLLGLTIGQTFQDLGGTFPSSSGESSVIEHGQMYATSLGLRWIDGVAVVLGALHIEDATARRGLAIMGVRAAELIAEVLRIVRRELEAGAESAKRAAAHIRRVSQSSLETTGRRIEAILQEIESCATSGVEQVGALQFIGARVTIALAAVSTIVWDVSNRSCPVAVATGNMRPDEFGLDFGQVVGDVLRRNQPRSYLTQGSMLSLFQRIDTPVPLLLHVVQRHTTDTVLIRGYQVFLERVARLCEKLRLPGA